MNKLLRVNGTLRRTLLVVVALSAVAPNCIGVPGEKLVLTSPHLTVTFRGTVNGPQLEELYDVRTGSTLRVTESRSFGMAFAGQKEHNDPEFTPVHEFEEAFGFEGAATNDHGTSLTANFRRGDFEVLVKYDLEPEAAVLQKSITCKVEGRPKYIAGIIDWKLKLAGFSLVWPESTAAIGQPLIFGGKNAGIFITTEWPRSQHRRSPDGTIQIAYRPGYQLEAGESKEVAAGAIGFFPLDENRPLLASARQSFTAHVTRRVKPQLPFPIKFTTWGPWLGQARADRLLEVMDDLAYIGTDLVHFDAGWQWPDRPLMDRLPQVRNADNPTWDRMMTQPGRLPNGLLPIKLEAEKRGMALSLWFDAGGNYFVREGEEWAIRDNKNDPIYNMTLEGRWPEAPLLSLAHGPYRKSLSEFLFSQMERYNLGGVMFDNNVRMLRAKDFAPNRLSLASGWNSEDVIIRGIWEMMEEAERRRPGIYRFLCMPLPWPWNLKYATHIHAGDPGNAGPMREAMATDYPARALAYERYLAWRNLYTQFIPPWGIKGDIAGWSVQQASPIPVNIEHTDRVIGSGEGWTYNMMMCFATTASRDIRFNFRQMPEFDRRNLKEWLVWDRTRSQYIHNLKLFCYPSDNPDRGLVGISHVANGKGVIYIFNRAFEGTDIELLMDERVGLRPSDQELSAHIVYPAKAPLNSGKISYGDTLGVPIIGKDALVIEIGLDPPEELQPAVVYEGEARKVVRSFRTKFMIQFPELLNGLEGPIRLEIGDHPHDRIVAKQILETLGAALGRSLNFGECLATLPEQAGSRLIIGSFDGLEGHSELGQNFEEIFYSRYLRWDGQLISAPLVARKVEADLQTYCLIAPRPDQLLRLSADLLEMLPRRTSRHHLGDSSGTQPVAEGTLSIEAPGDDVVLRFDLAMSHGFPGNRHRHRHVAIPGDLPMIHFQIQAESKGKRWIVWSDEIAPMYGPLWREEPSWLQERAMFLGDLGDEEVTFHFSARHPDGRDSAPFRFGFGEVSFTRHQTSKH